MFRSVRSSSNTLTKVIKRNLHLHEYQSMQLLQKYDVQTPKCFVASTIDEADEAAHKIGGADLVVKAQVLAGGRGKGKFKNGFVGGVHIANSAAEARGYASKMLGQCLVTKQTGAEGKPCNKVLISERVFNRRECYFAILMDRENMGPVIVASSQGGMDIEQVAAENPSSIIKQPVNINTGIQDQDIQNVVNKLGFNSESVKKQAADVVRNLYRLFIEQDCTLVEINPLVETHDGKVLCIDAKLNIDDNANFRHKELYAQRDYSQEDKREVEADKQNLNYIGLDGDIGCLVNGAGLAMATLDIIKFYGGSPANFLDIGGGASKEQVIEAFRILNGDPRVKSILVNIFGGIMRCDVIALGLIRAVDELQIKKPVIIRLAGTNVENAKTLIEESGLRMVTADDLDEAAMKAVRITQILKMAEDVQINVQFELPI